ncbi:hypothetical protein [Conexibacter arvalis]|uniref:Uncharacterized protein n=1 Tax=Conexibacter arvalis TaxID=912552 RepID=A0A840IIT3_9ACTN|nr:hypothetical protein [Conexibacter arvalis]MBB4663860.1 hypothetical protein [Conexibacter arvalis]
MEETEPKTARGPTRRWAETPTGTGGAGARTAWTRSRAERASQRDRVVASLVRCPPEPTTGDADDGR